MQFIKQALFIFMLLVTTSCASIRVGQCYRVYDSFDLNLWHDIIVLRVMEYGFVYERLEGDNIEFHYMNSFTFESLDVGRCLGRSMYDDLVERGVKG